MIRIKNEKIIEEDDAVIKKGIMDLIKELRY